MPNRLPRASKVGETLAMHLNVDGSGETGEVMLSGALTIHRANEAHGILLDAVGRVKHLRITLAQVTDMDLSFLQLVCATHRRLLKEGKKLSVGGPDLALFHRTVAAAGYQDCVTGKDQNEIWKGVAS